MTHTDTGILSSERGRSDDFLMSIVTRFIVQTASTRVCHLREPRVTSEPRNFVDVSVEEMYICVRVKEKIPVRQFDLRQLTFADLVGGTADFSWWNCPL